MTPIARMAWTCIDCPDPAGLAAFYSAVLDWSVEQVEQVEQGNAAWVALRAPSGQMLCFQRVEGYCPPKWPGQEHPQQAHLDLWVDDLDVAEAAVIALGATRHEVQPDPTFRVFLDPVGHPFCLCLPDEGT